MTITLGPIIPQGYLAKIPVYKYSWVFYDPQTDSITTRISTNRVTERYFESYDKDMLELGFSVKRELLKDTEEIITLKYKTIIDINNLKVDETKVILYYDDPTVLGIIPTIISIKNSSSINTEEAANIINSATASLLLNNNTIDIADMYIP